jgi:hypothetical protein
LIEAGAGRAKRREGIGIVPRLPQAAILIAFAATKDLLDFVAAQALPKRVEMAFPSTDALEILVADGDDAMAFAALVGLVCDREGFAAKFWIAIYVNANANITIAHSPSAVPIICL